MTLRDFLEQHGLAEHLPAFEAQRVTPEQLSELTDADLRDVFGVAAWGDRKRFLAAAGALRGPLALPVATPGHTAGQAMLRYALPGEVDRSVEGYSGFSMAVVPPCWFTATVMPSHRLGGIYAATHDIVLTRAFAIATTPVTQALWTAVAGSNPSWFKEGRDAMRRPVENVSWLDAARFCNALSVAFTLAPAYQFSTNGASTVVIFQDTTGFRLPTVAEWTCAARAGSDGIDMTSRLRCRNDLATGPVGLDRANAWGLHDIAGDVWEWCGVERDLGGGVLDPSGPACRAYEPNHRESLFGTPLFARLSDRDYVVPARGDNLGIRVARTILPAQ